MMTAVKEPRHVLILSSAEDVHAISVQHSLRSLGGIGVILDLYEYPQRLHLSQSISSDQSGWRIEWRGNTLTADEVAGVWYRRPSQPSIPDHGHSEDMKALAKRQVDAGVQGWLASCKNVINLPSAEHAANRKALQLHYAYELGLKLPDTCITNEPAIANSFWRRHGGKVIYKSLASHPKFFFETRFLEESDLDKLKALVAGPTIFQAYISRGRDLRITIVDNAVVATEVITSVPEAEVDWRVDPNADYRKTDIPHSLAQLLVRFVRRLGLRYGAIDIREDAIGTPYFLEVNPGGQFLFNDIHAKTDISGLLAEALLRCNHSDENLYLL